MELVKLILNLVVLIFPLIFSKKDSFYDERIKTINKLLETKKSDFEGMTKDEKSLALSSLIDDLHRIFELRT